MAVMQRNVNAGLLVRCSLLDLARMLASMRDLKARKQQNSRGLLRKGPRPHLLLTNGCAILRNSSSHTAFRLEGCKARFLGDTGLGLEAGQLATGRLH